MGSVAKTVSNAVKDVGGAATKVVKNVTREVTKPVENVVRETGNVIEANKDGINATIGSGVRIATSVATGGKSEQLGVGDYITKQFGGGSMKMIGQFGGNLAGAASGNPEGFSGVLKSTAKQYGSELIKGVISGGPQVPMAQPDNYVMQNAQGNQNMSFLSDLGDLAIDYGKNQLMGGAKDRSISQPMPQPQKQYTPPAIITAPAAPQQPMISKNMMIAGGALAGLAVLAIVLKK